eukprot:662430-Rhodomonas_salina.2
MDPTAEIHNSASTLRLSCSHRSRPRGAGHYQCNGSKMWTTSINGQLSATPRNPGRGRRRGTGGFFERESSYNLHAPLFRENPLP